MEDNHKARQASSPLNQGLKLILIFHLLWTISLSVLVVYSHVQNEARFVELENQVKACITTDATPKSFRFDEQQTTTSTRSDEKTYPVYRRGISGSNTENRSGHVLAGKTNSRQRHAEQRRVPSTNGTKHRGMQQPLAGAGVNKNKLNQRIVKETKPREKQSVVSGRLDTSKKAAGHTREKNASRAFDAMYCMELLRSVVQGHLSNSGICDLLKGPPGERGSRGPPGKRGPQGIMGPRGQKGDAAQAGDQQAGKKGDKWGCSGTMLAPPLFLQTEGKYRKYISTEGVSSEMNCKTTGNPSADVTWYKDDVILTSERYVIRERIITSQIPRKIQIMCPSKVPHPVTQSILVIKRSRGSDTGTYVCKARNMMGAREYKMHLTVRVHAQFTILPTNNTILQGDTVTLNCSASGIPDPQITWSRKDGRKLPVSHLVAKGNLVIPNITKAQEGTYVCVATNVLGFKSTEASLTVNIFPKITSFLETPLTINEHKTAVLPCSATGYPTPNVSWRKVKGLLVHNRSTYENETLVIRDVNYGDRGEYVCTANNIVGTVLRTATIIVQVAPKIIHQPKRIEFGYHTTRKVLKLVVFGFPPPNITWSGPALHHVTGRIHQSNGSLVITRTEYRDSGSYHAVIRNVVGEKRIETFFIVSHGVPPVFEVKPDRSVSLSVGQSLSLTCSAVGRPTPVIVWYHDGSILSDGVTGTRDNKTLTISSLKYPNGGPFMCLASNEFGSARQLTSVQIYRGCVLRSLGMESGAILNSHVTASSVYRDQSDFQSYQGRLRNTRHEWAAKNIDANQWLQIAFLNPTTVTDVATQGEADGSGEWVTTYRISYSQDGRNWNVYQEQLRIDKIFTGNTDATTVVKNTLKHPLQNVRHLRFLPKTWHGHISMRVEVYGC